MNAMPPKRAFTLIEVLAVVFVIFILAAIVVERREVFIQRSPPLLRGHFRRVFGRAGIIACANRVSFRRGLRRGGCAHIAGSGVL